MKKKVLVYIASGWPVKMGDIVRTFKGESATVLGWRAPHKPDSTGRVALRISGTEGWAEFYPSVINAEWRDAEVQP